MDDPAPQLASVSSEDITFSPQAVQLVAKLKDNYETRLLSQAKIFAAQQRADQVQQVHVEQARDILSRRGDKNWSQELLLAIGGALLGAFVQGFIEAVNDNQKTLIVVYVAAGFIGMGLIVWALRQR